MNRNTLFALAVIGAFVLLGVFMAFDLGALGAGLTLVWVAAWAYRFWELR